MTGIIMANMTVQARHSESVAVDVCDTAARGRFLEQQITITEQVEPMMCLPARKGHRLFLLDIDAQVQTEYG